MSKFGRKFVRPRLFHSGTTMSAFVSGVISPESLHRIAEVNHDVLAVKGLIVDQFSAGLAEEHLVLDLAFGATPFDD